MTFFKQIDPQWSTQEYDTATKWSENPTIGRWGCAMTSAAMILRHHNISHLPESVSNPDLANLEITPSTLNQWLLSQADGYVGSGLLNWMAVTRLTEAYSQDNGTPKLEYNRINGSSLDTAKNQLAQRQPVIFEVPGHFLVGNGIVFPDSDLEDAQILDPAFEYDFLSQHTGGLLSTRTLEASFTDLSYLLLVHDPELEVRLYDDQGDFIPESERFLEQISDPTPGSSELSPPQVVQQIAQPSSGKYKVEVSQSELGPFELDFWAYDTQANPTDLSQNGWVGTEPLTFELSYNKDGTSNLVQDMSFTQLRQDVSMLYDLKALSSRYWFKKLDQLAVRGVKLASSGRASQAQIARLTELIHRTAKSGSRSLSEAGKAYLDQQLQALIQ